MSKLSSGFVGQDSGQPWFLFWNTQSLQLLAQGNIKIDEQWTNRGISYLRQCHNSDEGGFRGAPHIKSHVASTYAAIMAIVNLASEAGYELVDILAMKKYLISVKNNF